MTIWQKIKCFFGFCPVEVTKEQEKAVMEMYKPEPKVMKVTEVPKATVKAQVKKVVKAKVAKKTAPKKVATKKVTTKAQKKIEEMATEVKVENAKALKNAAKKAKEAKAPKAEKIKVKRSWYNNGKTQKLTTEMEAEGLPKTWKKGKLKVPKKDK